MSKARTLVDYSHDNYWLKDNLIIDTGNSGSIGIGSSKTGYQTSTRAGWTTNYSYHDFTFNETFTSTPRVFIMQYDGNETGHTSSKRHFISDVSTTGFTMRVNEESGSSGVYFNWLAIQEKAAPTYSGMSKARELIEYKKETDNGFWNTSNLRTAYGHIYVDNNGGNDPASYTYDAYYAPYNNTNYRSFSAKYNVTFPSGRFSSKPTVFAIQTGGNTSGHASGIRIWAVDTSTTGTSIMMSEVEGSGGFDITWFAVEAT